MHLLAFREEAAASRLQELWEEHWRSPSVETRNELATLNLHLVGEVVRRMRSEGGWERDDMQNLGFIGLLDAIDHFRCGSPISHFGGYARQRVRGAILDEARRLDVVPRGLRRRMSDFRKETEYLTATHCAHPTNAEVAASMGLDERAREDVLLAINALRVVRLDEIAPDAAEGSHDTRASLLLVDEAEDRPDHRALQSVAISEVVAAMADLQPKEREILRLRYFAGLTQEQVGRAYGVSYSRISQIEAKALRRLRSQLLSPPIPLATTS
jgi:RNA polymerase sigma factor for flagellar operon FliA